MQKCHAIQPTNRTNHSAHVESVSAVETASERMISSIIYDAVGIIHHNIYKRILLYFMCCRAVVAAAAVAYYITSHRISSASHHGAYTHLSYRWLHCFQIHACNNIEYCVCMRKFIGREFCWQKNETWISSLHSIQCTNSHQWNIMI